MKKPPAVRSGIVFILCLIFITGFARAQTGEASPSSGTFFLQSAGDTSPPYPFDPYLGSEPVETINASNHVYLIQDSPEDFAALLEVKSLIRMSLDVPTPGDGGDSGGGDYTNSYFSTFFIDTNLLWLEITNVDLPNQVADLLVHNTQDIFFYQLWSKTNLLQLDWTLGTYQPGASGTNQTAFNGENIGDNPMMFFRAQQANCLVYIAADQLTAIEPQGTFPGQTGTFNVVGTWVGGATNDVTVYYSISGTASNGVDYTNLSGVAVLTNGVGGAVTVINVQPIADNLVEGSETVTLTLIPTNTYVQLPGTISGTIHIYDASTTVSMGVSISDAIEPDGPPGVAARTGLFWFSRYDFRGLYPDLDVFYQISGTASNGVDYSLLSGVIHFADGIDYTNLDLIPLADNLLEGIETVTLTLVPTNTYSVNANTNSTTGTVTIIDSTTTVSIYPKTYAVEPNASNSISAQAGYFELNRTDTRDALSNLTVYYQIGGTASNGIDYSNLTGQVTFGTGQTSTNIYVQPLADNLIEGDESVVMTILATNGYYADTSTPSAVILILEVVTNIFLPVVTNLNVPSGLDWHAPSNSLIVASENFFFGGNPHNFARIYTNVVVSNSVVVTNWTDVHYLGEGDEVKLATVKTNVGGFTNGDMYFGSGTGIGWVSSDGTRSNLNWGILTNSVFTNTLPARGGLYVDQTGVFSNQLIVVTSPGIGSGDLKGVWRVDAQGQPTLLTNIDTSHLEGVITLPNNPTNWGPWAGKIITGDEDFDPPLIYTIDTNGAVVAYDTTVLIPGGIHPEDFDIVPPNQSVYICEPDGNRILKLSASYLTNYVGDLMITDAGENVAPPKLFFVHWDAATTNFIVHRISYKHPSGSDAAFEHVTFAPIDLPYK